MRVMWAIYRLELRRFWFAPVIAGAVSLAAAAVSPTAGRLGGPIFGMGLGVILLGVLGGRAVDDQARFMFARPVATRSIAWAECLAILTLGGLVWIAGLSPTIRLLGDGRPPASFYLGQGSLLIVNASLALLAGGVVVGIRGGAHQAILRPLALVGVVAFYVWALPAGEIVQAVPYAAIDPTRWAFWAWVIFVAGTALFAFSRGMATGRGQSMPTLSTTWGTAFAATAAFLVCWSGWLGYLRAADGGDVTRVRRVHPGATSEWAMVTGDVHIETLAPPSFLVNTSNGRSARVPGATFGQPTAFSRDGRVMAVLLLGFKGTRGIVPVQIADLVNVPTLRKRIEIQLDDLSYAQIALSPDGRLLAAQTTRSLSVFDVATERRTAHVVKAAGYDAVLGFPDDRHVVGERLGGTEGFPGDAEIISLDVVVNAVTVLGQYQRTPNGISTLDQSGRYVAVISRSAGETYVERYDLSAPGALPQKWAVGRANAISGSPLALPDGRVVTVGWGSRTNAATLRVHRGPSDVASLDLHEQWTSGVQWVAGDIVALGRGRPGAGDDETLFVDIGTMTIRRRVSGLLPARLFTMERPIASSPSTLFVEHGRRVVSRPDLLH